MTDIKMANSESDTCHFSSNLPLKCHLDKRRQWRMQVNLICEETCTGPTSSSDQAGAGASLLKITSRIFADGYEFTISLGISWGSATVSGAPLKANVCLAMNFLRQATIPERLYLGRITSTARYNLTFVPRGSHSALLTNDSVTVGLCPQWNRLKRTKHVFAVARLSGRQI